ncbi:DNA-binding transcriptional regulator BolA-like [Ptychodera flava]|uniref:DNA-binding transcriptional regulator BolA-like n=1 Tax=Ptychodera flava TaxID=63121 RepID=UPI003969FA5D
MSVYGSNLISVCRNRIIQGILKNSETQKITCFNSPIRQIMALSSGPVQAIINKKLTENLQPVHIQVINESYMHNVPKGSETHFKVVIVSDKFEKQTLLKRHRIVNDILQDELDGPVHALSIQAKTPQQWEESGVISKSPPCLGGMKLEAEQKSKE